MKVLKKLSAIFLICSVYYACETPEDVVDFPIEPSKLVVNSMISLDSNWTFQVSKSLSVLDNAELPLITNANIEIYEDGELLQTLDEGNMIYDGYYYSSQNLPQYGKEYSIKVFSGKLTTVSATAVIPDAVPIAELSLTIYDSTNYSYDGYYYYYIDGEIGVKIQDPAAASNYYRLSFYTIETYQDYWDTSYYYSYYYPLYVETSDPVVDEATVDGLTFSDALFDGSTYEIKVSLNTSFYDTGKPKIMVHLESLTEEAYLYKRSYALYKEKYGDFFAEPVQVYSNIENGYGIFAGSNTYKDSLIIE